MALSLLKEIFMSDTSPVSKRLKQARILQGLSQKQLGIYAGIDEFSASARMNQYETGKHVPDFLTLKKIAMVLGYSVAYFYAEDEDLALMIKYFTKLNKGGKDKLLNIILNNP